MRSVNYIHPSTTTTSPHRPPYQLHLVRDGLRVVVAGSPLSIVSSLTSRQPGLVHRPPPLWHLVRDGPRVVVAGSPLFFVSSFASPQHLCIDLLARHLLV